MGTQSLSAIAVTTARDGTSVAMAVGAGFGPLFYSKINTRFKELLQP